MAKVVDNKITVEFDGDAFDVCVSLSDDGDDIFIEQDDTTIFVPRAELDQFISILRNWNAEHPRAAS